MGDWIRVTEVGSLIRDRVFVFFEEATLAYGTRGIGGRYSDGDSTVTLVAEERFIGNEGVSAGAAVDVPVGRHVSGQGWFQQDGRYREK